MKGKTSIYIAAHLGVLIWMSAFISYQNDPIETIKNSLNTYRVNYAPEKVYVHHDKPYYMAGEMLWFKAYVVDDITKKPTNKSGVLYIDLYNDSNDLIERLTLPIADGEAIGDINLPDDLEEGMYRLSALTEYMRNFGGDTFFEKEIFVFAANEPLGHAGATPEPSLDLQFFPESGELIAGLNNTVAFKAIDENGFGVPVTASLFDDNGKKVLDFSDEHTGMGSFRFIPARDIAYHAKINFRDGRTIDYPLPTSMGEGTVLHVDETSDPEHILIEITSNSGDSALLRLFAIANQNLLHSEELITPSDQKFNTRIPKSVLPTGIMRLTLTNADGAPLAERLVFVNHPESHVISINLSDNEIGKREEVTLDMGLEADHGLARISISVTADSLVQKPPHAENIKTYLLLSADLKGFIESPGYYFEDDGLERQLALRHLMMTQGWRKFGWNDMITQAFPSIQYGIEPDLNIRGRLVNRRGEPIPNGQALLFLKDRAQTFITTETNKEGYFTFRGFYFTGNIQVVIQGSDDKGRTEGVEVQMLEKGTFPLIAENLIRLPDNFETKLPERYVADTHKQFEGIGSASAEMDLQALLLEEIVVEGRAEVIKPFKLHQRADAVLYRNRLPVSPSGNILESLQGRVAGLNITRTGMNEFRAVIRGQGTPLYLLDGMPIPEETMQMINQFDINRIEILKTPGTAGIYGGRASGGVIALFTDPGYEEVADSDTGKHIIVERISGFNKIREFYIPSLDRPVHNKMPDLRSTIYWNPSITLDSQQTKSINFTTADTPGNYRITIEGITDNGHPLFREYIFRVN
ncbi:TonB-dependent receptor plug domain-containing protein [Anditalea andensis]|uniref:TonB-dependent receptor plug domain-containing protein n=1 Tax=Anditalea andensis TaxID=1048983 RepID=A0A074L3I2_9BACT|nr:TonB-dependent receptor plug domain-containing protein [Anditalea andensis]KEO75729.1 hypothetical protein EL17_22140 [Anditalea andensis]